MNKLNRNVFLTVALIISLFALIGCDSAATNTANGNTAVVANKNAANTTTANATNASNMTADAPKTDVAAGDKIGVAECDDFLEKYEACIMTNAPEAARAGFKSSMEQWRSSWKQLASNPQTKSTLTAACKQTMESAKQSTASFSCKW